MLCIKTGCVAFVSVQEATLVTSEAAALHSETQTTFSGNSLEAEIHLQISLVSAVFFFLFCWFSLKLQRSRRAPVSIINTARLFFSLRSGPKISTAGVEKVWEAKRRRRCQCSFFILSSVYATRLMHTNTQTHTNLGGRWALNCTLRKLWVFQQDVCRRKSSLHFSVWSMMCVIVLLCTYIAHILEFLSCHNLYFLSWRCKTTLVI